MAKRKRTGQEPPDAVSLETRRGAAPQMSGDMAAAVPSRDAVARRAYELYLARGGGDGRDMDDWLRAEEELGNRRRPGGDS